jgi:hypothetical protein
MEGHGSAGFVVADWLGFVVVVVVLLLVKLVDVFGDAAGYLNCLESRYKNTRLVRNAISSEKAVACIFLLPFQKGEV